MMRVVLDATVFVSAVLKGHSNPGRLVDLVRQGVVRLLVSPDILTELKTTLLTPRLRELHRKSHKWVVEFLRELTDLAELTPGETVVKVVEKDPSDNIYLACGVEGQADYIVSGDKHLLNVGELQGIPIVNPADFMQAILRR
jgi:putative PIN family toxin of toxin-antitoxin system